MASTAATCARFVPGRRRDPRHPRDRRQRMAGLRLHRRSLRRRQESVETLGTAGTYRTVLAGRHHAIHEFKWDVSPGGTVHVTVHWMFATGRSHPLYAITLDSSATTAGTVHADSPSPYGDMAGTTERPGTCPATAGRYAQVHDRRRRPGHADVCWDYTKANTIPYAYEWSKPTDSEMGLVATLSWASRIQGGDYFGGDLMNAKWGQGGHQAPHGHPGLGVAVLLNQ